MPDEAEHELKKEISKLSKHVQDIEHEIKGKKIATWVTAIGTALSGMGAFGVYSKTFVPPAATPTEAISDYDDRTSTAARVREKPPGSPPAIDGLVQSLSESKAQRNIFIQATRTDHSFHAWQPLDTYHAESVLQDEKESKNSRAFAALVLGAQGNKNVLPYLTGAAAQPNNLISEAAGVAIQMLTEDHKISK